MMRRDQPCPVRRPRWAELSLALGFTGLAAAAVNAAYWWSTGQVRWAMLLPGLVVLAMAALLPFTTGWRPFVARDARYRACTVCGMLWSPRDARTGFCPGCSGEPVR